MGETRIPRVWPPRSFCDGRETYSRVDYEDGESGAAGLRTAADYSELRRQYRAVLSALEGPVMAELTSGEDRSAADRDRDTRDSSDALDDQFQPLRSEGRQQGDSPEAGRTGSTSESDRCAGRRNQAGAMGSQTLNTTRDVSDAIDARGGGNVNRTTVEISERTLAILGAVFGISGLVVALMSVVNQSQSESRMRIDVDREYRQVQEYRVRVEDAENAAKAVNPNFHPKR